MLVFLELTAQIATLALLAADPPPLTVVRDSYPMLSPDGKVLLFQSNRSGREALYLADADGEHVRVLLDSGDDPSVPVWSPDGKRIAFVASVAGQTEVFVMNADATQRRRLTIIRATTRIRIGPPTVVACSSIPRAPLRISPPTGPGSGTTSSASMSTVAATSGNTRIARRCVPIRCRHRTGVESRSGR